MKFKSKKKGVAQYYKGRVIARFKNREFETENQEVIDALIELGYEHDAEGGDPKSEPANDGVDVASMKRDELLALAKEKGIKAYYKLNNDDLRSALEVK